jgi:hypothetical protein
MRQFLAAAAVAASLCCLAAPANAQMVSPTNPEQILAAAKEAGLENGRLITSADDNPYIEAFHNDMKTLLLFMNCDDDHKHCKTMQYYLGFNDAENVTTEKLNTWNREKRFARAYLDSVGDPVIEMDVDMDFDGLPRVNVVESLNTWQALIDAYRSHLYE